MVRSSLRVLPTSDERRGHGVPGADARTVPARDFATPPDRNALVNLIVFLLPLPDARLD
jgi:hypothetical protein